jgi:hypothetical protein
MVAASSDTTLSQGPSHPLAGDVRRSSPGRWRAARPSEHTRRSADRPLSSWYRTVSVGRRRLRLVVGGVEEAEQGVEREEQ